jgi:hypothetical protein
VVLVLAALSAEGGAGGGALGSAGLLSLELLLELLLLELLLLLLESESYIGGGVWVGNGCSSAAVEWGFEGAGASGAALLLSLELPELLLLPESESCNGGGVWVGNGCSSAAVAGDFETQGLSVADLPVVWLGDGHGGAVSVGFWAGVVWATQAADSNMAASME